MKSLFTLILLSLFTFNLAHASGGITPEALRELNTATGATVGTLILATYEPGAGAALALSGSSYLYYSIKNAKVVQARVTNDIQEFLRTGEMSYALSNVTKRMMEANSELTESEAIDLITEEISK